MKKTPVDHQPPLSDCEIAKIDLDRYTHYPELLFLHAIVQRGMFWYTALLHLEEGKLRYSSVNPRKFKQEEDARDACQQEHDHIRSLFNLVLPDFDIL
jgi:hypothetical protein